MADMNDIVRVAVDAYHGVTTKYSQAESMDTLRQALVAANNGSTKLNYKDIRDGKCVGLFTLVEEILSRTVIEGLLQSDFFNNFVEYRNVALGDQNVFLVEDSDLFVVSDAAEGTQGIRRQRLGGVNEVTIPTSFKVVRIYEELNRVLSGQVDFNFFIRKVAESFQQRNLNDIYSLWVNATAAQMGGEQFFPTAGTYDEDALLDVIGHVEAAANGQPATILGTKKALRKLAPAVQGNDSESDIYNAGYYGRFYGTKVLAIPQRHKVGSTEFVFPDDVLTIVAGSDRPIKYITEGQSTIVMGDPMTNRDFTQELAYAFAA